MIFKNYMLIKKMKETMCLELYQNFSNIMFILTPDVRSQTIWKGVDRIIEGLLSSVVLKLFLTYEI